jgi:hypothetical protein
MDHQVAPISLTERGRREAVALLRQSAYALEAMPRKRAMEALLRIGEALTQLQRELGRDDG